MTHTLCPHPSTFILLAISITNSTCFRVVDSLSPSVKQSTSNFNHPRLCWPGKHRRAPLQNEPWIRQSSFASSWAQLSSFLTFTSFQIFVTRCRTNERPYKATTTTPRVYFLKYRQVVMYFSFSHIIYYIAVLSYLSPLPFVPSTFLFLHFQTLKQCDSRYTTVSRSPLQVFMLQFCTFFLSLSLSSSEQLIGWPLYAYEIPQHVKGDPDQ